MRILSKAKKKLLKSAKTPTPGGSHENTGDTSLSAAAASVAPAVPTGPVQIPLSVDNVVRSLSERTVPPLPQPLDSSHASPFPVSSAPLIVTDATSSRDHDLWTRAFEIVGDREPELISDFEKHLAFRQDETAVSVDLSAVQSVEHVVQRLLEDREAKQWRIPLQNRDIKIRAQGEKLAKFFLWSSPIVEKAVSAQPYAALAWSGVAILLPVRIRPSLSYMHANLDSCSRAAPERMKLC